MQAYDVIEVHSFVNLFMNIFVFFRSSENSEDMDNWSWERVLCSDPEMLIRQVKICLPHFGLLSKILIS